MLQTLQWTFLWFSMEMQWKTCVFPAFHKVNFQWILLFILHHFCWITLSSSTFALTKFSANWKLHYNLCEFFILNNWRVLYVKSWKKHSENIFRLVSFSIEANVNYQSLFYVVFFCVVVFIEYFMHKYKHCIVFLSFLFLFCWQK